ncbi:MAG: FecR family protein [Pseudomonadota bacterium]
MGRVSTHYANRAFAPAVQASHCGSRAGAGLLWLALLAIASATVASGVHAAASMAYGAPPAAIVEGVVMPAWLERGGTRQPVFPGMVLQERDRIETGANARILLTLPEGSKVKLGESAQLGFDALVAKREGQDGNVFLKSTLSVVTGAFRFTTNALSKARSRREVDIRLATVTAGIRGTDLWGKQGGAKEIVCLLEGKIEVARDSVAGQNTTPVVLDQPLQFYIAPKGEPTLPIGRVPEAQLAQWEAETDITQNAGGASVDGRWKIRFDTQTKFAEAMALYEDLRNQGYAAQLRPEKKAGKRIYVVQLANLSSEGDARALANKLGASTNALPSVSR